MSEEVTLMLTTLTLDGTKSSGMTMVLSLTRRKKSSQSLVLSITRTDKSSEKTETINNTNNGTSSMLIKLRRNQLRVSVSSGDFISTDHSISLLP